jgi:plastocyanin
MNIRLLPALGALAILAALASCGSDSSGAGPGGDAICGCTEATAEDLTAQTSVTVNFGGPLGNSYAPKCVVIAAGTSVSFEGDFAVHPLSATSGAGNPITSTASGTTAAVTFAQPGAFGYQCDVHVAGGMCGAVYVQ